MATEAQRTKYNKLFSAFAEKASFWMGTPLAFVLALSFVVLWAFAGPLLNYPSGWTEIINIVPAIVTFLIVFLIQNSQNRETRALQLKVNELIRATEGAHTVMVNLEKLTEEELLVLCQQYDLLANEARRRIKRGQTDQGAPDISVVEIPLPL